MSNTGNIIGGHKANINNPSMLFGAPLFYLDFAANILPRHFRRVQAELQGHS